MNDQTRLLTVMPGVIASNPELRKDILIRGQAIVRFIYEDGAILVERVDPADLYVPEPLEPQPDVAHGIEPTV